MCNECDSLGHALIKFSGFIFRREIWMQLYVIILILILLLLEHFTQVFLVDTFLAIYILLHVLNILLFLRIGIPHIWT